MSTKNSGNVLSALASEFDKWVETVATPTRDALAADAAQHSVASLFVDSARQLSETLHEMANMLPHVSKAAVVQAVENNRTKQAKDSTREAEAMIMSQSNVPRASL